MSLTHLLAQYGYLAVFIGCLLEGETMLILAGFAAHRGYLSLPLVMTIACCAGTLGDQIVFFTGRRYGSALLSRWPALATRARRINHLIERYRASLILGVRFMYGLRLVGPLVIGMSTVEAWRFALLNLLGAALWATLIGGAGYLFGQTLEWLIADFKRYEETALLLILAASMFLALLRHMGRRRHGKEKRDGIAPPQS